MPFLHRDSNAGLSERRSRQKTRVRVPRTYVDERRVKGAEDARAGFHHRHTNERGEVWIPAGHVMLQKVG